MKMWYVSDGGSIGNENQNRQVDFQFPKLLNKSNRWIFILTCLSGFGILLNRENEDIFQKSFFPVGIR